MRRVLHLTLAAILVLLLYSLAYAVSEIVLDEIVQNEVPSPPGTVFDVDTVQFIFRLTNTDGNNITGLTNAFAVWTAREGAYTDNFSPITYDTFRLSWDYMFDGGFFFGPFGVDGKGRDTVKFGGFRLFKAGIPDGFSKQSWLIRTSGLVAEDTVCVDSTFAPPGGQWLWSTVPAGSVVPDWGGPYCFKVVECCIGNRGNVDMVTGGGGPVDIADLLLLMDYVFPPHVRLPCSTAGNVDGISFGGVPVNVADLTYLVNYLFGGGPEPPPCP